LGCSFFHCSGKIRSAIILAWSIGVRFVLGFARFARGAARGAGGVAILPLQFDSKKI
jgi:hypothetical protein